MKHCIIFIFIFLQSGIVYGQFKAVHISDSMLVKMKMDGDTSDWNWVPQKYLITEQSMNNNSNSNNYWKCRIKVGWSDLNHKLYIMAKVTDDTLISNNSIYSRNDCMQVAISADNRGGRYGGRQGRTEYFVRCAMVSASDESSELSINSGAGWMQEKQYINRLVKYHKNKEDEYEMVYEMCLSLWDKWKNEGPEYSSPSELYSSKRIKLAIIFNDTDNPNDTYVEWTNSAGVSWWRNADEMPEFILDLPSDKKGISWQGIRYILSQ
jgi:hypothetical protein